MKPSIKNLLLIAFFALFTVFSCQDEVFEETQNDNQTFTATSQVASLTSSTTTMDGSFDNIIDNASCFSIQLPVTVVVNGIEIIIDSFEDYAIIEAIFDALEDDEDSIVIEFPITIILSDFTEIVINDYDELEEFVDDCTDGIDDDIECIDFQYPITISLFNLDFDVIDTVTVNNDEELYELVTNLDDNTLASFNFPITMILSDGSTVVVNSNQELAAAIENAEDTCDEDDDSDFDDDDVDISEEEFANLLDECLWEVDKLEIGDQDDLEDLYEGYVFDFNVDGTVEVEGNGMVYSGTWGFVETDSAIKISLNITGLDDFNNDNWILHEIEDEDGDLQIDLRSGIDRLRFEQVDCDGSNDDCSLSIAEVEEFLLECGFTAELDDQSGNEINEINIVFNIDGSLEASNNVSSEEGSWTLEETDLGIKLTIEGLDVFDEYNGLWELDDCDTVEGVLELEFIQETDQGVLELDLYLDCDGNVDCSESDVDDYLQTCIWNVVNYNGSDILISFELDFNENQELIVTGAGQTFTGTWTTSSNGEGQVVVTISSIAGPDIQAINGEWIVFECDPDRLVLSNNIDEMVIEQDCENDGDPFDCFDDFALAVCDQDDGVEDGLGAFDLDSIFDNCPTDDVEYTFHETLADAENNINALISPYVNIVNPQTIYSRVSLAGNPEVFEIFTHELIVEDCSGNGDGIVDVLTDGEWIVANYNDSGVDETDDYNGYVLTFGATGEVVATSGGTTINGSWDIVIDSGVEKLQLDFGTQIPFDEFNDNWDIFDVLVDRVELRDVSGGDGTLDVLVFEKL